MSHLILVAVIVQLVITVDINGFQFGDVIAFPPQFQAKVFKYQHYAVYVGDETFPGKKEGDNIFERTRDPPGCFFRKLDMKENPVECNYLDRYTDRIGRQYNAGNTQQIKERINNTLQNCGGYNLCNNNCEHLATSVRYGVKVAVQLKNFGQGLCTNEVFIEVFHLKRHLIAQGRTNGACIPVPNNPEG